MRRFILALLPGLTLGCSDNSVIATSTGESTTGTSSSGDPTGDPTGSPTGSPTSENPTTSSASESNSEVTTAPATETSDPTQTTTDPSTTSTTSTTSDTGTTDTTGTTTSDTTTGPGNLCGADGPVIEATLMHADEIADCGPLEFIGQNQANDPGPVYALDGCPCDSECLIEDPWTFTIDAPKGWEPGFLPKCPRIVVERQKSKKGCELVGVAIWDTQEPEGAAAVYHAGSLLGPIQAVIGQIGLEQITVDECDCDNCCGIPTLLDLSFAALKTDAVISEGQSGMLGDADLGYEVKNFQSHLSGICDDSPAIDWAAKRVGKP
jgi:hypothetical protein